MHQTKHILAGAFGLALLSVILVGCNPTVQIKAPKKPIVVDRNVKIKHNIQVKVERDVDTLFAKDKGLF